MYASGAISMERLSIAFCTRSRGIMSSSASYSGRRYGSTFSCRSPGRNPRFSPASTAGRASTMRRTRLRARASTAIATARYVFPVPAGPMPITISCCAIACRYSRCPAVFAWITRRRPGRMILYSPSGVRPVGPCSSWLTRRSTSATSSGSPPPMRTRSTSAWATGTARSTAGSGPCSISVSPRNDTRTPSRCASATRLPSFTPASASGSTPSVESRWVISSVMAWPRCAAPPGPPGWPARAPLRTGHARSWSWGRRSRLSGYRRPRAASSPGRTRLRTRRAAGRPPAGRSAEAEAGFGLRRRHAEQPEDTALQCGVGDPDRSGAQLVAIVDGVVVQRAAAERIGVEPRHIIRVRRGERVMREHRLPRFRVGLEQREIHDPGERVRRPGLELEPADHLLAHAVEHGRRHPVGAADHQGRVTVADAQLPQRLGREVLADRPRDLLPVSLHPCEARAAELLRGLGELVHVLARQPAATLYRERPDPRAVLQRRLEERHGERSHLRGPIGDRDLVAQVRLVGAVPLHRFAPGDARERPGDLVARLVPQGDQYGLHVAEHVFYPEI